MKMQNQPALAEKAFYETALAARAYAKTDKIIQAIFFAPFRNVKDYAQKYSRMTPKQSEKQFQSGHVRVNTLQPDQQKKLLVQPDATTILRDVYQDWNGTASVWFYEENADLLKSDIQKQTSKGGYLYKRIAMHTGFAQQKSQEEKRYDKSRPFLAYEIMSYALTDMTQQAEQLQETHKIGQAFSNHRRSMAHYISAEKQLITEVVKTMPDADRLQAAWERYWPTLDLPKARL